MQFLFYLLYYLTCQQDAAKMNVKDIGMFQEFRHMSVILNQSLYFYLAKEYLKI